ncbi:MAG: VanW family protein, partial [Thermomicrobiales bacterium]|nr:VanW family protein [Thermomicrobiales bacterium]
MVLSGAGALALVATSALPLRCNGKFYPGVVIAGVAIGGMTREEALIALEDRTGDFQQAAVTYVYEDRTWRFSASELGLTIDYEATLDEAWGHGREDGVTGRYEALLDRRSRTLAFVGRMNEDKLDSVLQEIAAELDLDPVDAVFTMDGTAIAISPEQTGRTLDVGVLRQLTVDGIGDLQPFTITLPVTVTAAAVTAADLEASRAEAARLVSRKVTLRYGDTRWTVDRDALARSIVVPRDTVNARPTLDPGTLVIILQSIADEIYRSPVNAEIGWNNGVQAITESREGRSVDLNQLAELVIEAAGKETGRIVQVPVDKIPPTIDSRNLDALGIAELMAEGSSSFAGSSEERAINVEVSAQKVDHALIPPGGTLSFLQTVGDISVDAGFVEGKIIADGWYASDIGGGVCQVSTTVFRAALLAGLPFAEWHPHSFRVSFYELDGWAAGLDAAIYQPNHEWEWPLDLVITNPTDSWILLQMTTQDQVVRASLYGPKTGYQVELANVEFSDPTDPPP